MARKLKKSWIVELSAGYTPVTSVPPQFLIWAAVSVIGGVLKNNVWLYYSSYKIHPNQFIVLTAPPGIGKGTAIHIAWDIAKEFNLANVISDRVTAPKIAEQLAQGKPGLPVMNPDGSISMQVDRTATLMSPELATLISSSDWMLTFLCDMWDRKDYNYDTKNSGTSSVKDGLCCSLIGGCVPDYIRKLNKDAMAAISGGFTARTIFVYADKASKSVPWPVPIDATQKGKDLVEALKHDLQEISKIKGEMSFDHGAKNAFGKFFPELAPKEDDSDVILYFKSRMHVHVFKTAMIMALARHDTLIIEEEDMSNAIICLRDVLSNLNKTFRGVGDSDLAEATARVQNVVERKGYVTRNEILTNVHRHVNPENLTRILSLLEQIGFLSVKSIGGHWVYTHIDKNKTVTTPIGSIKP